MDVFNEVLKDNIPGKQNKAIKNYINEVETCVKHLDAQVKLGGSVAKGTYLKKDFDCDIFVMFDKKCKNISDLLGKALKGVTRIHGSRDYFQITKYGINFEIVPVIKIKKPSDALNVTDCSPLHVDWIKEKIGKKPSLRNEIILAKLFLKANGLYGAESYIKGFSGHVLDILIVNYGSFLKLLKQVMKWKPQVLIDVNKHKGVLNNSKIEGPLIVVDPIQPDRNAAAAVGLEKFNLLKKYAKEFIDNPNKSYFIKKKISLAQIKKNQNYFVIEATPVEGKKDVVGCKCLKVYEILCRILKGFEVKKSGWEMGKTAVYWFVFEKGRLDSEFIRTGPKITLKDHARNFKKKHNTFEKKGRLYAKIKRDKTTPKKVAYDMIKSKFENRVNKIKVHK